ncbi:hypothetical protein MMC25_001313 [Agyrium rufum]|nr:hypothetical protein [Agyrium rufum]
MAKPKPTHSIEEMENELGFNIASLVDPYAGEKVNRFYSDLRPVHESARERLTKEFDEYEKSKYCKDLQDSKKAPKQVVLRLREVKKISYDKDTITLRDQHHVGFYRFPVDIHYASGFSILLLLSEGEAIDILSVANLSNIMNYREWLLTFTQLQSKQRESHPYSRFFDLPREIREKVYKFAMPQVKWDISDGDYLNLLNFPQGLGDPRGFYYPLSKDFTLLRVDRQMREESLPLAYRQMTFHLGDIDDTIRFLVAIGQIGRDNIESLEVHWESRSDLECKWDQDLARADHYLTLPSLHAARCVRLLKQCKRLRSLRLYFAKEMMDTIAPKDFKSDVGILGLISLQGIKKLEVWSLDYQPLEDCDLANWLGEKI